MESMPTSNGADKKVNNDQEKLPQPVVSESNENPAGESGKSIDAQKAAEAERAANEKAQQRIGELTEGIKNGEIGEGDIKGEKSEEGDEKNEEGDEKGEADNEGEPDAEKEKDGEGNHEEEPDGEDKKDDQDKSSDDENEKKLKKMAEEMKGSKNIESKKGFKNKIKSIFKSIGKFLLKLFKNAVVFFAYIYYESKEKFGGKKSSGSSSKK